MTRQELEKIASDKGFTFSRYLSKSFGSEYIKIDSIQFRISDHDQPSHYQIRNYTNVNSYEEIATIISDPNWNKVEDYFDEETGKTYRWDSVVDGFIIVE